jgi:hypothetical protein
MSQLISGILKQFGLSVKIRHWIAENRPNTVTAQREELELALTNGKIEEPPVPIRMTQR